MDINNMQIEISEIKDSTTLLNLFNSVMESIYYNSFIDEYDKMEDFFRLSTQEFLDTYSYLSMDEYSNTLTILILTGRYPNASRFSLGCSMDDVEEHY